MKLEEALPMKDEKEIKKDNDEENVIFENELNEGCYKAVV